MLKTDAVRNMLNHAIGTDNALGIAVLMRGKIEIARIPCNMFPSSWFPILQNEAEIGDVVEVRLAAPLDRTELFTMASVDENGFVTGYCTEAQWKYKPAPLRRRRIGLSAR